MLDFFRKHNTEITWWVIGWLSFAFLDSLGKGNYGFAALDAALIYFNYRMCKL